MADGALSGPRKVGYTRASSVLGAGTSGDEGGLVEHTRLAYFDDRGPAVALFHMDPGSSTPAGRTTSVMMRFIYQGAVQYSGQPCPAVSSLYYPPDTAYEALYSPIRAIMLSVELQMGRGGLPLPYRV
jgi:hypothetical protein